MRRRPRTARRRRAGRRRRRRRRWRNPCLSLRLSHGRPGEEDGDRGRCWVRGWNTNTCEFIEMPFKASLAGRKWWPPSSSFL
jgi:hypothetical protein